MADRVGRATKYRMPPPDEATDAELSRRTESRFGNGVVRGVRFLLRTPISVIVAALLIVTTFQHGGPVAPVTDDVLARFGAGVVPTIQEGRWWTVLTASGFAAGPIASLVAVAAAVVLLGIAERLMGSFRTLVAALVTGSLGYLVGISVQAVGAWAGEWWAALSATTVTVDPLPGILGALMAASAYMSTLWATRTRVAVLAVVLVFLLYAGDPQHLYRLFAALAGLVLGAAFQGNPSSLRPRRASYRGVRGLLATIVAASALGPVVALMHPEAFTPFALLSANLDPGIDADRIVARCDRFSSAACDEAIILASTQGLGPLLMTFVPVVLLLIAAWGILKGRRFGLWLAVLVNVSIALSALLAFDVAEAVAEFQDAELGIGELLVWVVTACGLPVAIAVLLIAMQRRVALPSPRSAMVQFTTVVILAAGVLSALYFMVGWTGLSGFVPDASVGDLAVDTVKRFLPPHVVATIDPLQVPAGDLAFFLHQWVGPVFWAVFAAASVALLRRSESRTSLSAARLMHTLLERHGGGTLGYLGTWRGTSYWFADDLDAGVAYRLENGVALAISDPACATERLDETVAGFIAHCDEEGFTPVFYAAHGETRDALDRLGWHSVSVGEETVIDPTIVAFRGKDWQKVRQPLNRGIREGLTTVWSSWRDLPLPVQARVAAISEAWVSEKALPEMGFTLGGMDELRDPSVRLMLAVDAEEHVHGVTSWLPVHHDGRLVGWTIDFMRRADESMPGVMEYLIASAALHMKEEGLTVLSLSGAPLVSKPLADGEEPPEPTGVDQVLAFLARTLEPAYGFASLFRFKAKFNPRYETLWMSYADTSALPAIGIALSRAYLPRVTPKQAVALTRTVVR
ncbi:bifunctional lysylphosphatidylglycerol flippase/synthetase MprF [Agromyces sp. SYSU T00194]|uniref:bifunctional lysylphosphatidylglycerol flippase/synthetase MprF n=1 Tax=Agromyces chitinivorans TaxID=3158560 RepID=UPI00339A6152